MIRNTHAKNPEGVLVAYSDNSGVLQGSPGDWWEVDPKENTYRKTTSQLDILCKVETHNHPTAISFLGAATGVGGEIRKKAPPGIGGRSKAGLSAFMVSNLNIPGYTLPGARNSPLPSILAAWPAPSTSADRRSSSYAAFGNEFGRPQFHGLFRTLETVHNDVHRGYHKPIMTAGGMGNLKREHVAKKTFHPPRSSSSSVAPP